MWKAGFSIVSLTYAKLKEITWWDIKLGERGIVVWTAMWLVMSYLNEIYLCFDNFF